MPDERRKTATASEWTKADRGAQEVFTRRWEAAGDALKAAYDAWYDEGGWLWSDDENYDRVNFAAGVAYGRAHPEQTGEEVN